MNRDSQLFSLLQKQASEIPQQEALRMGSDSLTYQQLFQASGQIAHAISLASLEEDFVAILADKNKFAVTSLWGTLGAGKAYLFLNPALPVQRNLFILRSAGCKALIVSPETTELAASLLHELKEMHVFLWEESAELERLVPNHRYFYFLESAPLSWEASSPNHFAYISFTSGSTGVPKGVMVSQRSVLDYVENLTSLYALHSPGLRFSLMHELTFDITVHDLYLAVASGGTLCIPEKKFAKFPFRFIVDERINCWMSVPSIQTILARLRLLKPNVFPDLLYSFFCGEPLYEKQVQEWFVAAPQSRVINLYGPTEATCAITHYECNRLQPIKAKGGVVCVGKPFPNQSSVIRPTEEGAHYGELLLGGSQLADGYCNDPQRTNERFRPFPAASDNRYYFTGDIFEKDTDDDLFFRGRADRQIKIQGYRVELQEVESVLSRAAKGCNVAVVFHKVPATGRQLLIGFVEGSSGLDALSPLLEQLKKELPSYMVPEKLFPVKELPYNANGKLDLLALERNLTDDHSL